MALIANTSAIVVRISERISPFGLTRKYNIAAKPHQAMVVRCQVNRNTRLVNQSLPSNLGKLSRLNKRIRMYFSPK